MHWGLGLGVGWVPGYRADAQRFYPSRAGNQTACIFGTRAVSPDLGLKLAKAQASLSLCLVSMMRSVQSLVSQVVLPEKLCCYRISNSVTTAMLKIQQTCRKWGEELAPVQVDKEEDSGKGEQKSKKANCKNADTRFAYNILSTCI